MKAPRRRKICSLFLAAFPCFAASLAFGQTGGSLAGALTDTSGLPIAGAWVTALKNTLPPASGRVLSGADGSFLIGALPPGPYSLCVQLIGSALLDPCEWESKPPTTVVQAGQPTSGIKFIVKKGAIIPIRLNDTQKLLDTPSAAGTKPDVIIGVQTPAGLLHHAALASKDAAGRNLTVAVPPDTRLKLVVFSPHATVVNAAGSTLAAAGSETPLLQPSGVAPIAVTFNITGLR